MRDQQQAARIIGRLADQTGKQLQDTLLDVLSRPATSIREQNQLTDALAALDDLALLTMQCKARIRQHLEESRNQATLDLAPDTRRYVKRTSSKAG